MVLYFGGITHYDCLVICVDDFVLTGTEFRRDAACGDRIWGDEARPLEGHIVITRGLAIKGGELTTVVVVGC